MATFGDLFVPLIAQERRDAIYFCVCVPLGLQLPHPIHNVNDSGDKRKQASGDNDVKQGKKMKLQHHPRDRRHLQNSSDFAGPTWFYMHFAVEQMQYTRPDENHGIARDNENGKPGWKPPVLRIDIAPIADAQCNDGAQEQAFIGNRIENRAERAALFVTTRDISIEPVAYGCDQKNRDCGKTLPFERLAALDALAIIDSHRDEYRNHQDPNHRDFVRSRHNAARVTIKGESLSQGWQAIWPSPPTQISRSRLV